MLAHSLPNSQQIEIIIVRVIVIVVIICNVLLTLFHSIGSRLLSLDFVNDVTESVQGMHEDLPFKSGRGQDPQPIKPAQP